MMCLSNGIFQKGFLKSPEGAEAIRAHLYVDEREKCRQTLHQNTEGGRSLASRVEKRGKKVICTTGESEETEGVIWRVIER
jgi:hypothetical protein